MKLLLFIFVKLKNNELLQNQGGRKLFKYILQLIIGIITLAFSTFIAWYEGSAIIENSFEWKYSTPVTKLFNIEITNGHDISQLDYFVYAAKFQPLFPTIMMVSTLYIVSVIGTYLIKNHYKYAIFFGGLIGCICLFVSGLIFNSPTTGGRIFFWMTSISGALCMIATVTVWLINYRQKITVNTNKI